MSACGAGARRARTFLVWILCGQPTSKGPNGLYNTLFQIFEELGNSFITDNCHAIKASKRQLDLTLIVRRVG